MPVKYRRWIGGTGSRFQSQMQSSNSSVRLRSIIAASPRIFAYRSSMLIGFSCRQRDTGPVQIALGKLGRAPTAVSWIATYRFDLLRGVCIVAIHAPSLYLYVLFRDTGYSTASGPCPAFKEIGEKYGPFDLAMIPIWRGASLSILGRMGLRVRSFTLSLLRHV
jgi:hypothetical protein